MNEHLEAVLCQFTLSAPVIGAESYGCGHINRTYRVTTTDGRRYLLQKINHRIFRDVEALMDNIARVTAHLQAATDDPRAALRLVPTKQGRNYLYWADEYWRVYEFVEGSICLQQPETDADLYQSAVAFGKFQQLLADFPRQTLHETIKNFHNTPDRYRIFREAVEKDACRRVQDVRAEIEFALAREREMALIRTALDSGELPLRVTHNDTKLNNVLLDATTRRALCVVDLDTVMPGSCLFDFGDGIRFGAATAAEDTVELDSMTLSLTRFRVFTRGYLRACPDLTAAEAALLPLGAKTMTMESAVRFLTDHLDGDRYFAIRRPGHNLDRCRAQLKLVADMEQKRASMTEIVEEEYQAAQQRR